MNKNTELKRCPFCGGEAFPYKHKGFIEIVRCKKCKVEVTGYDREKVIDKWNNRPLEDEAYTVRTGSPNPKARGDYVSPR